MEIQASETPATKADIALVLAEVERSRAENKADIAMVLAELRAFRVWVEGKFELVEQRFRGVEQRFKELDRRIGALEKGYERLTTAMGWRLTVLNVTVVAAIIGSGALF